LERSVPQRCHLWTHARRLFLSAVLVGAFSAPAFADATVIVELKGKDGALTDGVVELRGKDGASHQCTTKGGRCEMKAVPGGMYTVEVKLEGKPSPKPKQVMIPPSGEAKLVVSAS
jgi:hypothetical protein